MTVKFTVKVVLRRLKLLKLHFVYAKYTSFKQPLQKQIVVCFDGVFPHGGLVDRLKGIVSFYQIAQELDYDFKLLFDNPFNLSNFLEPHEVDWKINRDQIKWHPIKSKFLYLMNDFKTNPLQVIKNCNAQTFYVYSNIDYSKSTYFSLNEKEHETKWRNSFNELFKKSQFLETKLNAIETTTYIAFHLRFTTLMGDFEDTTNKVLSLKQKQELSSNLLTIINRVKAEKNIKAYVFSDSINFIEYAKKNTDISVVEGVPFHMDNFNGDSNLEGHLKTLIDFFMIANSKKVYFLNIKPMYNSRFSKYAAIVGNTNFQVLEA
jgi:hypothetical protein